MTASNYKKMLKQLKSKPTKLKKYEKHNFPRSRGYGFASRPCRLCGRLGGHIQKYGLDVCRQCFRDNAQKLGFRKYK